MIDPKNIHCLGLNFKGVGILTESPLYFVKSLSCLCFDGSKVVYPRDATEVWTEVELGIVMKADCFNVAEKEACQYIEGYTVSGDVTCQNVYGRDHHLAYSKSRDNFCPTQNAITTIDIYKGTSLKMKTMINGNVTQVGNLVDIVYHPTKVVSYLSSIAALKKGDLILTGTCAGPENNILKPGDTVTNEIEEVGKVSYEIV
mgnify:FL=1